MKTYTSSQSIKPKRRSGQAGDSVPARVLVGFCAVFAASAFGQKVSPGPPQQRAVTAVLQQVPAQSQTPQSSGSTLPALPSAQTPSTSLRLSDLEDMALRHNPTIGQASADVQAAAGRARQAGLYPNPTLSFVGEEISTGPIIRGGEMGGGFSQRIVTGGKLGLSRRVAEQEKRETEVAAQGQRQRVLNAVRSLYYQALGDAYLVQVRTDLARLAQEVVRVSRELGNVGQADRPDVLAADIEARRLQLGLVTARNQQERTWRQLAAVVNNPALRPGPLQGDLEGLPQLDVEQELARIYSESPELRTAEVATERSQLALLRARREPIPDIIVSGGVRYNRELLEQDLNNPASGRRPVGKEGFFDIAIQIPIFNRNQGGVATARAEAERARLDVERTRLALRSRLADVYREYRDAITTAEQYRAEMLPKARDAYNLYLSSFRQMAAAYPQVIIAQRNLSQLQEDYVTNLVIAWQRAIEIQGLLLTGGTEFAGERSSRTTPIMRTSGGGQESQQ